jgi:hypothetical protein
MKQETAYKLNTILFVTILGIMGILFFVFPKKERSELEKRELCQMPDFSWHGFFKGKFIDSLDLYYADNFPFRDNFVALSFQIENLRGIQSQKVKFYNESVNMDAGIDVVEAQNDSLTQDSMAIDSNQIEKPDEFHNEGLAADVQRLSRGLLIYEGMAIQMFGGSKNTAKYLSKMVNEYHRRLGDKVKVHVGVTATHGEYYLPSEYIEEAVSERENIDTIYAHLDSAINAFKVTEELFKHKDEYIFFNTDHHWTGRGAYYAYVAFCKGAGIEPIPLDKMERGCIPNFLGTLYRKTRDQRLKENQDSVEYFKIPVRYKAYRLYGPDYGKIRNTNLYVEFAKGGNAYGVFLGGDYPAVCVASTAESERRLLILKNSYGNPISTYFPSHFERTYIIDYRYFKNNLIDFIEKNGVTDLLFFHNSFSANTPSHVDMAKRMMQDSSLSSAHPLPPESIMFPKGDFLARHRPLLEKYKQQHQKNIKKAEAENTKTTSETPSSPPKRKEEEQIN